MRPTYVSKNKRPYRKRKTRKYGGKLSYGGNIHNKYGGSKQKKSKYRFRSQVLQFR